MNRPERKPEVETYKMPTFPDHIDWGSVIMFIFFLIFIGYLIYGSILHSQ